MAIIKCRECGNDVSDRAKSCPKCGCPITKSLMKRKFNFPIIRLIVIAVLFFAIAPFCVNSKDVIGVSKKNTIQTANGSRKIIFPADRTPSAEEKKATLIKCLDIKTHRNTDFDTSVLILDLSITNNTPFLLKDITITCPVLSSSGTKLNEKQTTIYRYFYPHQVNKISNLNMGLINQQGVDATCSIVDLPLPGEEEKQDRKISRTIPGPEQKNQSQIGTKKSITEHIIFNEKINSQNPPNSLFLDFSVINLSDVSVKDIVMACSTFSQHGELIINAETTLHNTIKSQGNIDVNKVDMGPVNRQVDYIECEIADFYYETK